MHNNSIPLQDNSNPNALGNMDERPRSRLSHLPTRLEEMPNLSQHLQRANLFIKRDDCTGLGMGGNKARQLEFYFGEARAANADTILITGATQSNFARLTGAGARKLGMECHIQVEKRVPHSSPLYGHSGNLLLSRIFGATLHVYPEGEDEEGADRQLEVIAADLKQQGKKPYVIHLGPDNPPFGALGYVDAAREILGQLDQSGLKLDAIIVASGSGATHAGLLFGLRALGSKIPVKGICVRREETLQRPRIIHHCSGISKLLGIANPVVDGDVDLNDAVLAPGYGKINQAVLEAINLTAHHEGIILDPVYTGRAMAGLLRIACQMQENQNLLFVHTGGQPAVFAYEDDLIPIMSDNIS